MNILKITSNKSNIGLTRLFLPRSSFFCTTVQVQAILGRCRLPGRRHDFPASCCTPRQSPPPRSRPRLTPSRLPPSSQWRDGTPRRWGAGRSRCGLRSSGGAAPWWGNVTTFGAKGETAGNFGHRKEDTTPWEARNFKKLGGRIRCYWRGFFFQSFSKTRIRRRFRKLMEMPVGANFAIISTTLTITAKGSPELNVWLLFLYKIY